MSVTASSTRYYGQSVSWVANNVLQFTNTNPLSGSISYKLFVVVGNQTSSDNGVIYTNQDITTPPTISDVSVFGFENQYVEITLNVFDPNRNRIIVKIVTIPKNGAIYQYSQDRNNLNRITSSTTVTDEANRLLYLPNNLFVGRDNFTYYATNSVNL